MPFGFGPWGGGGAGAGHPTPRRRRQQAVEAPREVMVFIDERRQPARHRRKQQHISSNSHELNLAVDVGGVSARTAADIAGPAAVVDSNGSIFTPKIRNVSAEGAKDEALGAFLALPNLDRYAAGGASATTSPASSEINHHSGTGSSASKFVINPRVSTLSESPPDLQQQQQHHQHQQQSSIHHGNHKAKERHSARRRSTSFGSVGGLSLGSSTVHTLSDDEDAHDNGTLDGYHDHDGEDDDNASVHSLLREEVFENAVLKVSFAGGIVTLEYPPSEAEEEIEPEATEAVSPPTLLERRKPKAYDSEDTDNDYSDDDGVMEGNALPPLPRDEPIPHHFELQSTNIHSLEDEEMRKKNEIKLAVLEASAKSYKDADKEIPDDLLAQINECRRASSKKPKGPGGIVEAVFSAVATASAAPSRQNSALSPTSMISTSVSESRDPQVSIEPPSGPNSPTVGSRASSFYGDASSTRTPSFRGEDVRATPLPVTATPVLMPDTGRIRKLRITKDDEIHVLPCQCAFKLVGMQGLNILGPTMEDRAMDQQQLASNSLHGTHVGSILQTPVRKRPSLPASLQQSAPAHLGRKTLAMSTPVRSNLAAAQYSDDLSTHEGMMMAKTPSAQAARSDIPVGTRSTPCSPSSSANGAISQIIHHSASPDNGSAPLQLGGPSENTKKPNSSRLEQSTFQSMGYHEITLMRKGSAGNRDTESEREEFVDWDALTIRCRDHDEMDAIISSLKTSARAHVVPFSPNPRAKLKKKKQEEAREILKKRRRRRRSSSSVHRLRSASSGASLEGIDVHQTPHNEKERPSMTSPLTPPSSERHPSQKSPLSRRKKRQEQSEKFNKEDYCECCGFQFTLLTRRHHCRKVSSEDICKSVKF